MTQRPLRALCAGLLLVCSAPAGAQDTDTRYDHDHDGRIIAGVDVGVMQPLNAFRRFSDTGGVLAPFVGYMFNDYIGLMAQGQFLGAGSKDVGASSNRDDTYALAGGVGPRLALPIGPVELYGTFQVGGLTGLTGGGSITDSSWGFSTGGGINYFLNDDWAIGGFGRWNRFYQRVHSVGDVRYASGGLAVTYSPHPEPPPPPVAQAEPPPPPPPPAPPTKRRIVLRALHFDFDKATIRSDARPVLDEAVRTLKEEPGIIVIAEGHTDSVGSEQYNQRLSLRRAEAVKDYLVRNGIDASRIRVEGRGESNPVASNATAEGRAQNRRVELRVENR